MDDGGVRRDGSSVVIEVNGRRQHLYIQSAMIEDKRSQTCAIHNPSRTCKLSCRSSGATC
jgi:hypothetical protein